MVDIQRLMNLLLAAQANCEKHYGDIEVELFGSIRPFSAFTEEDLHLLEMLGGPYGEVILRIWKARNET